MIKHTTEKRSIVNSFAPTEKLHTISSTTTLEFPHQSKVQDKKIKLQASTIIENVVYC